MSKATRHCPDCDAVLTHRNLLLCHPCWGRLPVTPQNNFNRAPTPPDRRAAYKAILDNIRERKANPELFALP